MYLNHIVYLLNSPYGIIPGLTMFTGRTEGTILTACTGGGLIEMKLFNGDKNP